MVRVMFISDLHVEDDFAFRMAWLKQIIDKYRPDMLFSAGDNGELMDRDIEKFGVPFYTIYGNHDRPELIHADSSLSKYWLRDGLHIFKNGLRVLAWNGIFGFRTDRKRRWYHRSLDDAVRLAFRSQFSRPHVFISHEVPYYTFKNRRTQEYLAVMNFIVKMSKPLVWINGHMHLDEPVQIDRKTFSPTTYIRVESRVKGFVVIDFDVDKYEWKIVGMSGGERDVFSFGR